MRGSEPGSGVLRAWEAIRRGACELVYPAMCTYCGAGLPWGSDHLLCHCCLESLEPLAEQGVCRRCAMPAPVAALRQLAPRCPSCLSLSFGFAETMAWGVYRGSLREVVRRLKIGGQEALAMATGELLADAVAGRWGDHPPDCIVPMPMHWRRRLKRGFPLSQLLAGSVGRRLGWPVRQRTLKCRRTTRKQGTLSPQQRRTNVQAAFRVPRGAKIRGADVLLIDDVLTSGATASSAAAELKNAGAARVRVAVLARGVGR